MKIQANQIRPGMILDHQGKQWSVLKINILQPGKGGAFIQVEMRDIKGGNKTNERWRTQDSVEKLMVEEKDCSFLYAEGDTLHFMDSETYEQFTLPSEVLGDQAAYLQDGMLGVVKIIEGLHVGVAIPDSVTLAIVEADPVVKGQTASSSYKPALLENGVKIMVPPFIESGTRVVVNTADGTYVERAKD
ncbi:MAG: elongation factor P [Rhodospirillales bacterium]|nr:elongation factor P [Rhodospirillales bacterium]MCW8860909.1 elongation factor P [Rhodospirillales bacterium]MCW8951556.1 elongation factor P [Rhodospirillales bacterium]MCW8971166.1 elongation factor P [Rhodospirillales bacterium]MCW9003413.1 elongation factor P [Rhodospirillales bacterium]